jgi:histone deacetylase complex regulatory component SIN3
MSRLPPISDNKSVVANQMKIVGIQTVNYQPHSVATTSVTSSLSSNLFVTTSSSTESGSTDILSPTSRKRLKLDVPSNNVEQDIETLKKLIIEHKSSKLRAIREKLVAITMSIIHSEPILFFFFSFQTL